MKDLHVQYELIVIQEHYYNIIFTQAFSSPLFIVTLQHSNVSKLITVCVLSYKVYCAYKVYYSDGAMALLNKISVVSLSLSTSFIPY